MKIKNIRLTNFRKFKNFSMDILENKFIVFIGGNGVGKSSILDALAMPMAHISGKLTSMFDAYKIETNLIQSDITNGESRAAINMSIEMLNLAFNVECTKEIDQKESGYKFNPDNILKDTRSSLKTNDKTNLPLMVYYRINRTFQIENNIQKAPYYNKILEGYRNSFTNNISAFSNFEHWYISEENIENQEKVKMLGFEKQNLKVLRKAITSFLTKMDSANYSNLRVERNPESNLVNTDQFNQGVLVVDKNDETISINQLSSGEKMVVYLVADITRRLLLLNQNNENSLSKSGIVLIDELEMHLHPNWQRNIVLALQNVFPNIQFIATTHSPQILSNLNSKNILQIELDQNIRNVNHQTLGVDSNSLLESVFDSSDRPNEIEKLINDFHQAMESELDIEIVAEKLEDIRNYKSSDNGIVSDSLLDELSILLSAYKFEKAND